MNPRKVFDLNDPNCLYEVCRLKYRDGFSEREIARYFGFEQDNRTQIRKALARAEEQGIVVRPSAAIIRPGGLQVDYRPMEGQLATKFGLKHVQIVEGFSDAYFGHDRNLQNILLDRIAQAAGFYFDNLMSSNRRPQVVCVNWGYTIRLFVSHVLDIEPAQKTSTPVRNHASTYILPMVGIMGTGNRIQVAEREAYQLALELARKYDAIPRHLPCPAIIRDREQAKVVEQLEPVRSSLELLRAAQVAVTGIGFVDDRVERYSEMTIVKQELVTAEEVKLMRSRGAVGEIANWFFDDHGRELDGENEISAAIKPIGLGLAGLRQIVDRGGTVVAICGSDVRRLLPLRACLNNDKKLITALFTDHLTAQALLNES
jgi:DNA-binding transcriptional regulator LsrR (DeoR family)